MKLGIRRKRRDRYYGFPVVAVAFGAGLLLAMFCSFKSALVIAAVALIYVAISSKPC